MSRTRAPTGFTVSPVLGRTLNALAVLAFALTLATPAQAQTVPPLEWRAHFQGVALAQFTLNAPRPMVFHVARIDLATPGLRWLATPAAVLSDEEKAATRSYPAETRGLFTSRFLRVHGLQLAINAAPFGPVREEEGGLHDVAGLQVSNGVLVSGAVKAYPSLVLLADGRAAVVQQPFNLNGVRNAVGGFDVVLRSGQVMFAAKSADPGARQAALHPRTAAGVSADGRKLWLVVVDGRQIGYSEGASLHELAQVLQQLGASDGINLDGGGTSTMVVQAASGQAQVVNRPIHGGVPGRERVSASHLGLWALPLP